ncbi:MAG TPA: DUF4384 domain-containing protein, partial [Gemmatimonadales bacterium]|nr:DUF4384 domain-containing protein [Gemmatimonadales bacterium]
MFTLFAALLAPVVVADTVPPVAASVSDPVPAIQITLDNSSGNYFVGQHVGVRVETRDDGYLIVFRVNADGQIQVLFPLDPDVDAFVRGGKEYEIRARDGQQSFQTDVAAG